MNRAQHLRRGFTLVELLVVIGIIALLIGILIPVLNKARQAAATAQCASNMKQLAQSLLAYAIDNKGRLIPSRIDPCTTYPQGWYWPNELVRLKYIANPAGGGTSSTTNLSKNTVFQCPNGNKEINTLAVATLKIADASYPRDERNNFALRMSTIDNIIVPCWYQLATKRATKGVTDFGSIRDAPHIYYKNSPDTELRDRGYIRVTSMIKRLSEVVMVLEGCEGDILAPKFIAARHGSVTNQGRDAQTNIAFFDGHVGLFPTFPYTKAADFMPFRQETIFYLSKQ